MFVSRLTERVEGWGVEVQGGWVGRGGGGGRYPQSGDTRARWMLQHQILYVFSQLQEDCLNWRRGILGQHVAYHLDLRAD